MLPLCLIFCLRAAFSLKEFIRFCLFVFKRQAGQRLQCVQLEGISIRAAEDVLQVSLRG